jgi:hypothetical protein
MPDRKKLKKFQIIMLTAAPVGTVDAEDQQAAIEAGIKQYGIRPDDAPRVIAIQQA